MKGTLRNPKIILKRILKRTLKRLLKIYQYSDYTFFCNHGGVFGPFRRRAPARSSGRSGALFELHGRPLDVGFRWHIQPECAACFSAAVLLRETESLDNFRRLAMTRETQGIPRPLPTFPARSGFLCRETIIPSRLGS